MSLSLDQLLARLQSDLPLAPDKPEETFESTAWALWYAAAGQPRAVTRARPPLPHLDAAGQARLQDLLARRIAGEPLAYLTGRQEFLGLEFQVAPGALIPRRETELLGSDAVRAVESLLKTRPRPNVLDLCTGAGNIAIALATRFPTCAIWATDLEAEALVVAAHNARLFGVSERIRILQGDLFGALAGEQIPPFDLITCNPPYLSTRHAQNMPQEIGGAEPAAAFDGGPFGVSVTLRLIREAPQYLAPGGWLCFEMGAGQGPMLEKRLRANEAFVECNAKTDEQGTIRALQARVRP